MSRIESRASMVPAPPSSGRNDGMVQLGNPGFLMFLWLEAAALQQGVGVLVPLAIGEVVSQDSRRRLRLVGDAQAHIRLGQAIERLLGMSRRLVVAQNGAETIDRGGVVAPIEIEAADRHLLAGELIRGDLDLEFGVADI